MCSQNVSLRYKNRHEKWSRFKINTTRLGTHTAIPYICVQQLSCKNIGVCMSFEEMVKSSPVADSVLKALNKRQRAKKIVDLRNLAGEIKKLTGSSVSNNDMLAFVQNMETAGLGRLIIGRKNAKGVLRPNRFKWTSQEIADAAKLGKLNEVNKFVAQPAALETIKAESPTASDVQFPMQLTTEGSRAYITLRIPIGLERLPEFLEAAKSFSK